jgi:heme exporter protein C
MATTMVTAMLVMMLGFWMYSMAVTLARMRCVILERERQPAWGKQAAAPDVAEVRECSGGV